MMLTEETAVESGVLPVATLREQLRLGTGFADDGGQDPLLERYLRAAMAAIEARTGKALMARRFRLRLGGWRDARWQVLPVAPVREILEVVLVDRAGVAVPVEPERWRLEADMHRPRLMPKSGVLLPAVPVGGAAEIVFEAGFAATWEALPPDLAQAVMLLAAQYHETRTGLGSRAVAIPFGVTALVDRWRCLRAGLGAAE